MTEQEFNSKLLEAKVLFDNKINSNTEKSVPFANYVASKKIGNAVHISGQLPRDLLNESKVITGKADNDDDVFDAKYAAAMCAMQVLLVLKNEVGDLSKVKSCVQLSVFVNSGANFINQHLVANGASDLVCEYFDKSIAQHTRCAVGVATLPLGALVEVGAIFEI